MSSSELQPADDDDESFKLRFFNYVYCFVIVCVSFISLKRAQIDNTILVNYGHQEQKSLPFKYKFFN